MAHDRTPGVGYVPTPNSLPTPPTQKKKRIRLENYLLLNIFNELSQQDSIRTNKSERQGRIHRQWSLVAISSLHPRRRRERVDLRKISEQTKPKWRKFNSRLS